MRLTVVILVMLICVGCYNHTDSPLLDVTLPNRSVTISQLQELTSPLETTVIEQEIVVLGRVTATDEGGNFYKSIVVEDETGALELLVGEYNLARLYPEGLTLALRLRGCAACYRYGVLQVGSRRASYEADGVDYLESRERIDEVIIRGDDVEPIPPAKRQIAEFTTAECGRLVEVDSLMLVGSSSIDTLQGETLDMARWRGYALFRDNRGDTLVVYTRESADFAMSLIPHECLSLSGVLQYGKYSSLGNYYQLKLRYAEDCAIY